MESSKIMPYYKKRIEYIDALRGFTMFLVVYWHVMALSFGITAREAVVGSFFLTFRMPMFFFISGFLGYRGGKNGDFDFVTYKSLIKKKAFVQLVPTFIFFSIFHIVHDSSPLVFFKEGLTGYWFTLVLFELFVIQYTILLICNKIKVEKASLFTLVIISIIGNIIALWINTRHPMPRISLVLTLNNLFYYIQFFTLGCAVKMFPKFKEKLTSSVSLTVFTVLFVVLFIAKNKWITHDSYRIIYYAIDSILIKYCGLIMVLAIFTQTQNYFAANGRISKTMQFVGRRTLDIYLLHYFFLPSLEQYKPFFIQEKGELVVGELVIMGALALIIISICLLISTCLRKSSVLAKYLFGILPKN